MVVLWPHGPFISFACPKETKQRKGTGCTFLAIPSAVSAKQKELASLKQLFVFNAPTTSSISRQKRWGRNFGATLLRSLLVIVFLFTRCSLLFSSSFLACTCHPEERSDEGSEYIPKRSKQRSATNRRAPQKTNEATFSNHPPQQLPAWVEKRE